MMGVDVNWARQLASRGSPSDRVVSTTIVGAVMMLIYVVTGTIVVPIVLHALFDLRSLVLIPMAVHDVHRIDGVANPVTRIPGMSPTKALAKTPDADVATPPAPPA